MILIKLNSKTHEFNTLQEIIYWVKNLGEFVTLEFDGMEVAGKFGVDSIIDGKPPNGEAYK